MAVPFFSQVCRYFSTKAVYGIYGLYISVHNGSYIGYIIYKPPFLYIHIILLKINDTNRHKQAQPTSSVPSTVVDDFA